MFLILSQEYSPTQWKTAIIVPILKKSNSSYVSNYRPISLSNDLSKVFEFAIHDQMSHYFKHTLNPVNLDFKRPNLQQLI
jgi:hypothetical protein